MQLRKKPYICNSRKRKIRNIQKYNGCYIFLNKLQVAPVNGSGAFFKLKTLKINIMKVNPKQMQVRENITSLSLEIAKTINDFCNESNYDISNSEILKALNDVTNSAINVELKNLWSEKNQDKKH